MTMAHPPRPSTGRLLAVASIGVVLALTSTSAAAESLPASTPESISPSAEPSGGSAPEPTPSGADGQHTPVATVAASSGGTTDSAAPEPGSGQAPGPSAAAATSTTSTLVLSDVGPSPAPAAFRAVVAVTVGDVPVEGGSVRFGVDGATVGSDVPVVAGIASIEIVETVPGAHRVTAAFSGARIEGQALAPSSAPATVFEVDKRTECPDGGGSAGAVGASTSDDECDDHGGRGEDDPGVLALSTPYTDSHPLSVPPMVLQRDADCAGNPYQYQTDAPFVGIMVQDSRPGRSAWTVSALADEFLLQGVDPAASSDAQRINPQNVGLTNLAITSTTAVPESIAPPRPAGSGPLPLPVNFTVFDNPAAPHLVSGVPGSLGLGGTSKRAVHANRGFGTSFFVGTMSITAPITTMPGVYRGVVTFTLLGS
ncbi:MAG: Ig-like domain repeat protein [Candidatus Nanopelagicales bacterium]